MQGKEVDKVDHAIKISIDSTDLDVAIEKANRLLKLLRKIKQIADSTDSELLELKETE